MAVPPIRASLRVSCLPPLGLLSLGGVYAASSRESADGPGTARSLIVAHLVAHRHADYVRPPSGAPRRRSLFLQAHNRARALANARRHGGRALCRMLISYVVWCYCYELARTRDERCWLGSCTAPAIPSCFAGPRPRPPSRSHKDWHALPTCNWPSASSWMAVAGSWVPATRLLGARFGRFVNSFTFLAPPHDRRSGHGCSPRDGRRVRQLW